MSIRNVILVGHCGFDAGALRRFVQTHLPQVALGEAQASAELAEAGPDTLLLINRVLDGDFDCDNGIDLIHRLGQRKDPPRMILISNYADAQASAEAAGARPGFGKSQLRDPRAAERLLAAAQ